ncbi:MAG: hypothetical protein ACK559_16285, partial [bacterium]
DLHPSMKKCTRMMMRSLFLHLSTQLVGQGYLASHPSYHHLHPTWSMPHTTLITCHETHSHVTTALTSSLRHRRPSHMLHHAPE